MGKKEGIESAGLPVEAGPDHKTGPTGPENSYVLVKLSLILFKHIEDPATAKRVSVFIQETAGSTGVFKAITMVPVQYFWSANPGLRIF
jgi:hypothetical protein